LSDDGIEYYGWSIKLALNVEAFLSDFFMWALALLASVKVKIISCIKFSDKGGKPLFLFLLKLILL
jgi:hypothetical protein